MADREGDRENPYRFPALREERAEAHRRRLEATPGTLEELLARGREFGFAARHKRRQDGSMTVNYASGQVVYFSPEEVRRLDERRAQIDRDEEIVHGPPAKTPEDAVTVTSHEVPFDTPSKEQEELLFVCAELLDRLPELADEERDELCRALNAYGAERWGMLPLVEAYRAPESWDEEWVLGFRLNAFEAVTLPANPYDPDRDEEVDGPSPWHSDAGASALDRILEVFADTSDEEDDRTRLLCERAPTMGYWLVRNGRLYEPADWPALYAALEGRGRLWHPFPEYITPILVAGPYQTEAYSVAALMERAKREVYDDEVWAAWDGDAALSEETVAAMERLEAATSSRYHQLDRIKRRERDRVKETWAALVELKQRGRALLPSWRFPDEHDEDILISLNTAALDEQMRSYHELNPELELEPLKRHHENFAGEEHPPATSPDPSPGFQVFLNFDRRAWDDPGYVWAHLSREELAELRGKWVATDEFHRVLASGDDPEALKATPRWRYIVSIPDSGFEAGLVVKRPEAEGAK